MALERYDGGGSRNPGAAGNLGGVLSNIKPGGNNSNVQKPQAPSYSSSTSSGSSGTSGSSSGSSSSGGSVAYNPQQDILNAYKQRMEDARAATLRSIDLRLQNNIGQYEQALKDASDQYQALRNQSEVERYKTRASMREALANRGQLDSGFGRQETLELNTKFGNAINNINLQEQAYKNSIQNAIAQLKAEAEAEKASAINQYNASIAEIMASL